MAVSMTKVICPYCMATYGKDTVLGSSGLINYCGTEKQMTCDMCGKDFQCIVDVTIKYKTIKI